MNSNVTHSKATDPKARSFGNIFAEMQQEVERVFDDFVTHSGMRKYTSGGAFTPAVDVAETADAVDVTAELPGMDARDIDVTAQGQTLVIRGEKKTEKEEIRKDWHQIERSYGAFVRTLPLGFSVDTAKVDASFDKGVLKIHVSKPPGAKSDVKKIEIKPGA